MKKRLSIAAATGIVLLATAFCAAPLDAVQRAPGYTPDPNAPRSQVPDDVKWNLAPLFADDAAFDAALEKLKGQRAALAGFRGKLADARALRECLDLYFEARLLTNKATLYGNMKHDSAKTSTAAQAMNDRAQAAMGELMQAAGFIRQEVLSIDDKTLEQSYARDKKLAGYRPYLSQLRRRKSRVLGADAEKVLSLAGDNLWAEIDLNELPSDHERTFSAVLSDIPLPTIQDAAGKPVQMTLASYGKYRADADRRVRRDAVEGLFATLMNYRHALAATLSGQIRFNVFLARSRGYDTALGAYLDKDAIDPKVYTNLIDAIHANLAPLHRYVRLRKKVMELDDVHVYDLYPPMVKAAKRMFPYAEAQKILPEALAPLGPEVGRVLREGLDPKNGWIDVYPHKDKASGAFCIAVYGVHPYVKMNYFGELDDLSTLAHEYGHALHSHLSMKHQPYVTFNYSAFNAEIASTINEKLLHDYLYARARDDEERLYLLNELVETIRTTIYRQTLFSEFELRVHTAAEQGTPLTADWLNQTYADLLRKYYGPDFTVGTNDGVEWAYVPHFYYKYYVFAYATGLSAGIALADRVQPGGAKEREAYLGMLRGGSSKDPLALLAAAGVDLTRPTAVEAAARLMDRTLAEMEKILARTGKLRN